MKLYYTQMNIGRAKYVVSFHDGVKTYPDSSPFYGIAIFKNQKKMKAFIKNLLAEGYKHQ